MSLGKTLNILPPQSLLEYTEVRTNSNAEEAEIERFYEDLQDLLELTLKKKKKCPFHYRELECKSKKSRNTWSNRQIWPWNME